MLRRELAEWDDAVPGCLLDNFHDDKVGPQSQLYTCLHSINNSLILVHLAVVIRCTGIPNKLADVPRQQIPLRSVRPPRYALQSQAFNIPCPATPDGLNVKGTSEALVSPSLLSRSSKSKRQRQRSRDEQTPNCFNVTSWLKKARSA